MTPSEKKYVVIGSKPWNRSIFAEKIAKLPGNWLFFDSLDALDDKFLEKNRPRYIFFLHWSSRVPDKLLEKYECVCFHMTDLPYGRGGSPLQNLIISGHRKTMLTALKMTSELDAGPVYHKEELSLEGGAEEIYIRATYLSVKMIRALIESETSPVPQSGKIVKFQRRKPAQSRIDVTPSLCNLFDFIRMLDADGYPPAFLEYKGFKYEFRRPAIYNNEVVCDVRITKTED